MSKKNFDIYLNLSSSKLSIAAFKKLSDHNPFFKEYDCVTNLNKDQLNFENAEKTIEKNIFEIEKKTGEFLNDIYLMVETPESISINLSLIKDNEGKKIEKRNVQYLVQDAKQQILRNYHNEKIIHIIIAKSKFNFDEISELYFFPSGRWDIKSNKGVLIKLSETNLLKALNLAYHITINEIFKNDKVIDLRIYNHVISTNE